VKHETPDFDANRHYNETHPHGKPMTFLSSVPTLPGAEGGRIVRVAAVAVLNSSGQILAGFNNKRHVWDIPQGVVEEGESPIETAIRELEEETGICNLTVDNLESIALFRHKTTEFIFPWETSLFMAHGCDISGVYNREPHKCESLKWFAPVQLPTPRGLSLRILLNLLGRE
jgi:8-oxo-dGTP pyrophosphatase MutT (NUDIX family)